MAEVKASSSGGDSTAFSTLVEGARRNYPPPKISVDPATPLNAASRYEGMSLVFSDEFKDPNRTKAMFVFEDLPYGVPGNTGDINIASIYSPDTISMLPEGGLRLSAFLAPDDEKRFMEGWNGTYNSNWESDVGLWSWHAPKVTTRLNGRFLYGMVETRIKAPKGYGTWPAAWLNGCYGFVAESSGEFLLQEDYPFLCGQVPSPCRATPHRAVSADIASLVPDIASLVPVCPSLASVVLASRARLL